MLVEFSVTNFRSFKDKQTLSLVTKKNKNSIETDFPRIPHLLKRISIMGPNASGKSNLIQAMAFARQFVRASHKSDIGEIIAVEPYLLSADLAKEPSGFEFIFLIDETVYQYGFAATCDEIVDEWLFVTHKGGNLQKWLLRGKTTEKGTWYLSPHLKGRRKEWIKETRENTLLLSLMGTQKNVEIPRKLVEYVSNLGIITSVEQLPSILTSFTSHAKKEMNEKVLEFIKRADLGIINLKTEQIEFTETYIDSLKIPNSAKKSLKKEALGGKTLVTTPMHLTEEKKQVAFDFNEHESDGTKMLFALAFPIIDALESGDVLVIDEIDRSMHFKEFEFIIDLFTKEETNPHGAQLIFTNHDVTALKCLQRDEIYFVEKTNGFSSELSALSDYENRDDVPFLKRYLDGLYGALPHIGMGV